MITRVASLPALVFPTIPSAAGRWAAMVPVVGTLAACWGAGVLRFGKTHTAWFTATLLVCLGIGLLAGLRAGGIALARAIAADDTSREDSDDGLAAFAVAAVALVVVPLFGALIMWVMTAGGLSSSTAPGLNMPAQVGIWLWLLHEAYCYCWHYLQALHQGESADPA